MDDVGLDKLDELVKDATARAQDADSPDRDTMQKVVELSSSVLDKVKEWVRQKSELLNPDTRSTPALNSPKNRRNFAPYIFFHNIA